MRECYVCGKSSGKYKYCSAKCKMVESRKRKAEKLFDEVRRSAQMVEVDFGLDSNVFYVVQKLDEVRLNKKQMAAVADAIRMICKGYRDKATIKHMSARDVTDIAVDTLREVLHAKTIS